MSKITVQELGVPQEVSSEQRYAQLHRDIERGLESDRCWSELSEVCLSLGKVGEAVQSMRRIQSPAETARMVRILEQHGIIVSHLLKQIDRGDGPRAAPPRSTALDTATQQPEQPASRGLRPVEPPRPGAQPIPEAAAPAERFLDECREAGAFLMRDQMPLVAMALVLLFPLATSIGFLLPGSATSVLGLALRFVPIAAVLGVCLHVARRVLLDAAEGNEDPPATGELLRGSWRGPAQALAGGLLVTFFGFGPCLLGALLELPWHEVFGLSLMGVAYAPVALLGLAARGTLEAMLPMRVWRVASVDPLGTFKVAGFFGVSVVVPVLSVLLLSTGAAHLRIAVVGPILVGPLLALGRLLGRYAWAHGPAMTKALDIRDAEAPVMPPIQRASPTTRRTPPDRRPSPRLARRQAAGSTPRPTQASVGAPVERRVEANAPAPRQRIYGSIDRVAAPHAPDAPSQRSQPRLDVGRQGPPPVLAEGRRMAPTPSAAQAARMQKPVARPTPRPVRSQPDPVEPRSWPSPASGRAPHRRAEGVTHPERRAAPRHPLPPPLPKAPRRQ